MVLKSSAGAVFGNKAVAGRRKNLRQCYLNNRSPQAHSIWHITDIDYPPFRLEATLAGKGDNQCQLFLANDTDLPGRCSASERHVEDSFPLGCNCAGHLCQHS